jgi:hypothetical protein
MLYTTVGCLCFSFFTAAAVVYPGNPLQTDDIGFFYEILGKSWLGRATYTPVGPRPYDITFKQLEPFFLHDRYPSYTTAH